MHDMHPEDRSRHHGAHRVNDFIYRRIGEVLATRRPDEMVDDPNSRIFHDIDGRVQAIRGRGIEPLRITVASALAHIQHSGQRESFIESAGEFDA